VLASERQMEIELSRMVASGVESIRVPWHWRDAQPYRTIDEVPPEERDRFEIVDGVPTDFTFTDSITAATARRNLSLLPVIVRAPKWALLNPTTDSSRPRDPADYARYLGALVRRYGHRGTFWDEHPELPKRPIRDWQIWNEPNLPHFWCTLCPPNPKPEEYEPFARSYVALLRVARRTIKSIDPKARAVLAGLVFESWISLREVYRAGGRRHFDVAAIHPFTAELQNVRELVRRSRRIMGSFGDSRKPLMITEMSWTSGLHHSGMDQGWQDTPEGQARRVTEAYQAFVRDRRPLRISRIYWYTWATPDEGPGNSFNWAGLRRSTPDGDSVAKPAFHAFNRVILKLIGCRPAHIAGRCRR
jgi:hypothetical protein